MTRRVLFVAPAVPSPTRNGLRMRGWLFLRGLARDHRVTLVAGSPGFPNETAADVRGLGDLVDQAVLLRFDALHAPVLLYRRVASALGRGEPLRAWLEPTRTMRRRLAALGGARFHRIHVLRLYMLPMALAVPQAGEDVSIDLDVDDWESQTHLALADLAAHHDPQHACQVRAQARAFEAREREWLPRVSRVFACSDRDAAALAARHHLRNVVVVENAVRVPAVLAKPSDAEPADLLFIGALGYFPNQDAVRFLLDEVLCPLRTAVAHPFRLVVAGEAAPRSLRARLRAERDVLWVDSPLRVEPLYERARVALAPIRAGGGTRVKVLEAFAQGRPVVATAAAVEGLAVEPGVHFLRAETAVEWVEALRSLLETPARGHRLAEAAFAWVRRRPLEAGVDRVATLAREDER